MAMAQQIQPITRVEVYASIMAAGPFSPNHQWLARIVSSWLMGDSVLPDYLGLEPEQFALLCKTYFPHTTILPQAVSGIQSDFSRMLEKEDLIKLLADNAKDDSAETRWMISLIVSACLGNDHLWQDLGLWQRSDLSALIQYHFPKLAALNDKDMKWKKFLYKQMCDAEGIYICRAPSCEVCTEYTDCFNINSD